MKVMDLVTGKVTDREEKIDRQSLIDKQAFEVDGVEFAGWCITCSKPILKGKEVAYINTICGHLRVDIEHKYCRDR